MQMQQNTDLLKSFHRLFALSKTSLPYPPLQKGETRMSAEDNKAIVRRMYEEVFNQGNVALVDELIAPNMVDHFDLPSNVPLPAELQFHPEEFKHFVSQWRTTFPDFQYTIELQVAEGDLVVTRATGRGTHLGEYRGMSFKGIPPTGKQVTWTITAIDRIADGKIVESWFNEDAVGRLQQIGALPTPEPAS
jgi:predicted ester cyclase